MSGAVEARDVRTTPGGLRCEPLSDSIGAVADGVDLREGIDADMAAEIRQAVIEFGVVFFRNQPLSEEQLQSLASNFGELTLHPVFAAVGDDTIVTTIVDDAENPPAGFGWHTDLSWMQHPPVLGFLNALEIPERGGDTIWVSLKALYNRMSGPMRDFCAGLTCLHRIDPTYRESVIRNYGADIADQLDAENPATRTPLVTTHPEDGQPMVSFSPLYLDGIPELDPAESAAVLDHLTSQLEDPSLQVRWQWAEGDLVIWDERSTVHRALADHAPQTRRVQRCTVS